MKRRHLTELYYSVAVGRTGPIPGLFSMTSLACSVFHPGSRSCVSSAQYDLKELDGAGQHPSTMNYWKQHPSEWEKHEARSRPPAEVIPEFVEWVDELARKHGKRPVLVGRRAAVFVDYYLAVFADREPFDGPSLDVDSLLMGRLGVPYRDVKGRALPRAWVLGGPVGIKGSSIAQGRLLMSILRSFQEEKTCVDKLVALSTECAAEMDGLGPNAQYLMDKVEAAAKAVDRSGFSGWSGW